MKSKLAILALILVLTVFAAIPVEAAPDAGPCIAGGGYSPSCDVNHDGVVNVLDIQLTAGHWNQTGTFTSDNSHNHLGQMWTGTNNPLTITGAYGAPLYAPLNLSNSTGVGLRITSANGGSGIYIDSTSDNGLFVNSAGDNGLEVATAVNNGLDVNGFNYAGYFRSDIYVWGNCVGCLQANFGINAGDRALHPGDIVSVQGVTTTDFDTGPDLWQIAQAQPSQAIVGVVSGRAELVTEEEHRPSEAGKRLVPREGAAQPGEYVTVVYSGPMQVKVAPGESAIAAGTRLTAATDGTVRPLQTRTVEGMVITEGAPVVGVALEAPKDGLVWVLVNPQ